MLTSADRRRLVLPVTQDHASARAVCNGRPFEVDANRVSLTITGPCRNIVIAGNHNDVTWRQVGRGPRPALLGRGPSNPFHRGVPENVEPS